MNELQARGIQTIPTYEVATMMTKEHWEVLRMLEGYEPPKGSKSRKVVGIIPTLRNHNVVVSDYFIESTYKVEGNTKTYKCYECTKMGCEVLANKMTGEKGTLFTAEYVKKFNKMEQQLKYSKMDSYMIEDPVARATRWIEEYKEKEVLANKVIEMTPRIDYLNKIQGYGNAITTKTIAADYGMSSTKFNKLLHDLHIQYKEGKMWHLYQEHKGNGYEIVTYYQDKPHMKWTLKGAEWLYHILKDNGYTPVVEKDMKNN